MSEEEITKPVLEPMKDRNGYNLKVGDIITYNGGKGRIVEYLGAGNERNGAEVRVISRGQKVDIALLLVGAEYVIPEEERPHAKYGV
jgi:hypothetical protein